MGLTQYITTHIANTDRMDVPRSIFDGRGIGLTPGGRHPAGRGFPDADDMCTRLCALCLI